MNLNEGVWSTDADCCTYPKGYYFESVRVYLMDDKVCLEGKGRLGCLTKIKLTESQAEKWLKKYTNSLKKEENE